MAGNIKWEDIGDDDLIAEKGAIKGPFGDIYTFQIIKVYDSRCSIDVIVNNEDTSRFAFSSVPADIDTAKKIVERAVSMSDDTFRTTDLAENLKLEVNLIDPDHQTYFHKTPETKPEEYHHEMAKKAGYVQGVCESVLAITNNDNRRLTIESPIDANILGKKLLTDMNVTKEMAQKYAKPETYKELEKGIFAPVQEQKQEQTQSHSRSM